MNYKNNRRNIKSISPLGQRNITPECNSKIGAQTVDSQINAVHLKQFTQSQTRTSTHTKIRHNLRDDDFMAYSLAEVNLELDNNLNQIVYLLGRRKTLAAVKKRKVKEQMQERLERARCQDGQTSLQLSDDEDFNRVVQFCQNTEVAIKILRKIFVMLPNMRGPRVDQDEKSQSFWAKNKQLENEMDSMLQKLKSIDRNLQNENKQVLQICKSLDHIEQTLKSIVGIKGQDHLQRVQPLFNSKKKNYDSLNYRVKEREKFKDTKIQYIKRIRDALNHLKMTRENRLNEIAGFFGFRNVSDFERYSFKDTGDFTRGFQQLLKLREKESCLSLQQRQIWEQLQSLESDQEHIYNQLLRKQSDQAKAYHSYNKLMTQKIKYVSILSMFTDEKSHHKILSLNPQDISKKFNEYKTFLRRFMEQDSLIKQGLVKTNETLQTFSTLQQAIENEKERRHELLSLLETCIRKRRDYEHKKQQIRNIMVQITKNQQDLTQFEQDLETILADGDIQGYKRIGNSISKCETEKVRLNTSKQKLERDLDVMDREVVGMATRVQQDFEDILCQIIPSDYEYSLKNGDDVKKLRNHLRKMYKRLGILSHQ